MGPVLRSEFWVLSAEFSPFSVRPRILPRRAVEYLISVKGTGAPFPDDVSSGLAAWLRIADCNAMAFDRIQIDPTVCNGKPTIRGLRFTVDFVLKLLGDGYTAVDITREYPELRLEDVYQAARYGAWLASEQTFAGL